MNIHLYFTVEEEAYAQVNMTLYSLRTFVAVIQFSIETSVVSIYSGHVFIFLYLHIIFPLSNMIVAF